MLPERVRKGCIVPRLREEGRRERKRWREREKETDRGREREREVGD